ncbi:MAG: hypothetical protein SNJ74_00745 [Fimbriimonadaceae bacterium]
MRTVPAEQLHATLFFAAAATEEAVALMSAAVASLIWTPVGCRPGTVRPFGRNAVGLTLEWSDPAGVRLARAVSYALAPETTPPDEPLAAGLRNLGSLFAIFGPLGRRWLPHITLARAPKSADLGRLRLPKPPPSILAFDSLALFESRLTPAGPEYRVLARSVERRGFGPVH